MQAYVRDTSDILSKLPKTAADNVQLATFDVENLYGNISNNLGMRAIEFWLEEISLPHQRISKKFILEGLALVLENNNFFFNGNFYRQILGTAMGTKVAPVYATLTLGYLERELYNKIERNFNGCIAENFRDNYFRYLDDVLLILDSDILTIENIDEMLNDLDQSLNFKLESYGRKVNFLDLNIQLTNNKVETDIYYKATDSRQYLNFHSHHPRHVKVALPYNLSRRICINVSSEEVRVMRLEEMKSFLLQCNYPLKLIEDGIRKGLAIDREEEIIKTASKEDALTNGEINTDIVHVSTYHCNYSNNASLIKNYYAKLKEHPSTENIFNNKNMIFSRRQPPNLKTIILTNARLEARETAGVSKCNKKRCQLCNIIITGNKITFKPTNNDFYIKFNMTCNSTNVLYVIECQGCRKMYIGETGNLRFRTNLHRDHATKNIGLGVSRHLHTCVSGRHKFNIMPFYKMNTDDQTARRTMENYFISKFKPELNRCGNQ